VIDLDGLTATLRRINALRHGAAGPSQLEQLRVLEHTVDEIFGASRSLAVYGSLVPGGTNHHVVQALGGEWSHGQVEGERYEAGWGAPQGYAAMRWIPGAPPMDVHVLVAPGLADFWPTLDAFEGADYRRSLVPVVRAGQLVAIANLYECRHCAAPHVASAAAGKPART
jgi:gamma-glutamylcyclotransferase (GGCT)/AIG2-like uncharacterized protein YtfP